MIGFGVPHPDLLALLREAVQTIRWQDVLDIIIVSYVLYRLFLLIKGTRAVQLLRGMLLLLLAYVVSSALGLHTITWLVKSAATVIIVAIPVVFQPELRRALALLGQGELFRSDRFHGPDDPVRVAEEIVTAVRQLAARRIGALIILERQTGLAEFAETGTPIDALVSAELLSTLFFPNSPLHDGAVIVKGRRIVAAGALLPLSEGYRKSGRRPIGTRHRAALGLSETTDALAIVVSEETGTISVAREGQLYRHLSEEGLRDMLVAASPRTSTVPLAFWMFSFGQGQGAGGGRK